MSSEEIKPFALSPKQRALAKALNLNKGQQELLARHGTPAEFSKAVYACCPSDISMDEARAAIDKYNTEWEAAK